MKPLTLVRQKRRSQYAPYQKPVDLPKLIKSWTTLNREAIEFANAQLLRFPGTNFVDYYDFYMETAS